MICLSGCKNFSDTSDIDWKNGDVLSVSITLPRNNTSRSVSFYEENETSYYVVSMFKGETKVDRKEGNPGDVVIVKTVAGGKYKVFVEAYNSNDVLVAKGEKTVELSLENPNVQITISINPSVKEKITDTIILNIELSWKVKEIIPFDMIGVVGSKDIGSYYLDKTELTYAKWYEVYQWAVEHGYVFQNLGREGNNGIDGAAPENPLMPVTMVSWRDAIVWCNAASEKEGLQPVYYVSDTTDFTDKTRILTVAERYCTDNGQWYGTNNENMRSSSNNTSQVDSCCRNLKANGYRLPTNAEWDYAVRAEDNYEFSGSDNYDDVSWYDENSSGSVHEIKTKKPNSFGFYNMSGNVGELTFDFNVNSTRSIRGGTASSSKDLTKVTGEAFQNMMDQDAFVGFRVACSAIY